MSSNIKKYIKEHCDGTYTPGDISNLAKIITEKSGGYFSKKKASRLMCYYAYVLKGKIMFNTKNKDKYMTLDKLGDMCKNSKHKSSCSASSDSGSKDSKKNVPNMMGALHFELFDICNEKKTKHVQKEQVPEDIYEYPQSESIVTIHRNNNPDFGPYSTQSVNDKQADDKLSSKCKNLTKIYNYLSSIDYPEQRSAKWFEQRKEKITASDGGVVVGVNSYEPQWKFVHKKVIEPPFQNNVYCYHGKKFEAIATMVYEHRMNVKVTEFGMVPHQTHKFLGASPDGIVSPYKLDGKHLTQEVGRMLEIKCPYTRKINKVGKIKGEICPIYYWVQVQLQLECCDLEECDFWQCEIGEYDDVEDFEYDTDIEYPYLSRDTKMEKGALIQLLPHIDPEFMKDQIYENSSARYYDKVYASAIFIYPPKVEMSPNDVSIWVAKTCANIKTSHPQHYIDRIVYWKMVTTHNVTINRDKKWFEKHLPTYRDTWSYVTYFRENQDKANIVFEYIDSLNMKPRSKVERDNNEKIMEIYETVCKEPDNDAPEKEHRKYASYIANIIKETDINIKNDDKKYRHKKWDEEYKLLYEGWDISKIVFNYINSHDTKKMKNIDVLTVYKFVNQQPGENDSCATHEKYIKYIKNLVKCTKENNENKKN